MKLRRVKSFCVCFFVFIFISAVKNVLADESRGIFERRDKILSLDSQNSELRFLNAKKSRAASEFFVRKPKNKNNLNDQDGKVECGGTLRGSMGRLKYETHPNDDREKRRNENENENSTFSFPQPPKNCIWLIKIGTRSKPQRDATIVLTVEKWRLSPGSTLNFYTENQLQTEFPQPIVFMNTNHSKINDAGVFRITGQSFVVVLSSNHEPDETHSRLSLHFRWFSEAKVGDGEINSEGGMNQKGQENSKLGITTTTNYVTSLNDRGWIFWSANEFRLRQKSTWVLNAEDPQNPEPALKAHSNPLSTGISKNPQTSLNLNLTVYMDMPLSDWFSMNSCDRASFQLYEVLNDGILRRVVKHCRGVLKLDVSGVKNQLLVFIKSNSTEKTGNGFRSVEMEWEIQRQTEEIKIKETTTETPASTPKPTEAPPTPIGRCPNRESISPCSCVNSAGTDLVSIDCFGGFVTQENINNVFSKIRRVNKMKSHEWILINKFRLQNTQINRLDFLPFFKTESKIIDIEFNKNLNRIFVSSRNHTENPKPLIKVNKLRIVENSQLTDPGFGKTLKYFSPVMKELILYRNKLSGESQLPDFKIPAKKSSHSRTTRFKKRRNPPPDDSTRLKTAENPEFLPGLSKLTELSAIYLNQNQIPQIRRGQFQENTKLVFLSLSGNQIDKVESDSFRFSRPSPKELKRTMLKVDLSRNLLDETGFPADNGLNGLERPVHLDLDENRFESLPSGIFEPFLRINRKGPRNTMSVRLCPIVCDERVSWFKTLRASLEDAVLNSECVNEPGRNIFTSLLVEPARSDLNLNLKIPEESKKVESRKSKPVETRIYKLH